MPRSITRSLLVRLQCYTHHATLGIMDAAQVQLASGVCAKLETLARKHIQYQTDCANGLSKERRARVETMMSSVEANMRECAAKLPGGPWQVEFQGRGGGLCVVLALVNAPDEGDGMGGGWNIGR